ncbi:MAG: ATP-binding cassette domain-containing protein [Candidatus Obscuribacterales bacterium]|jgi:ATPase subunit of ABC transporter with duplicated ATPase domains|nr:ATP-binding cassette domain-containing protein [Candidatus Obscuribacterales bacterium]
MITVNNVTKSYGTSVLFENVNVAFNPGNRYGLTGPNGAGKSTFMRILTGEDEATNNGVIARPRKVGILRQDQFAFDDCRIIDTVIMGNKLLWEAIQERDKLSEKPTHTDSEINRLTELETVIADENGYMAEFEAGEILSGIGIPEDKHGDLMSSLATDYKFRVLLAQALFGEPDALLLDEPTNHLDLDTIHFLEEFLIDYKGSLVVISHDRHFLNAVCTHIADIDYQTIIIYTGNYDDMVAQKVQARQQIESSNKDRLKKIAQLQEFVARFGSGQRASQAQSRRKEIQRLALTELKRSNIQRPFLRFEQEKPAGKETVQIRGLSKSFGDLHLFKDFDLEIMRGEKVAIIGPNGVGKTTLVRSIIGELEPDAGSIQWGFGAEWNYYPQDHTHIITPGMTVLDWMMQFENGEGQQHVRGLLGRMLFSGEDANKPTEGLSGGERARLLLARMMLIKKPILVMDEPTNHLDLESVSALAEGLSAFPGNVFVVSHDRDLVSEVATRIVAFTPKGLVDFRGPYDEFIQVHPLPERKVSKW